jgi:hypothetical protein
MWTSRLLLTGYRLVVEAGCWRARMPEHPMETTLQQIEKAIQAELYYVAIVMALTLPDICAALETENAYSGRDEYKKWYRENLAGKFPAMSDADCYSLRCGVVHKGNLGLKGSEFSRVVFSLPNSRRITMHNNIMNDSLQFDAVQFCHDIVASVRGRQRKCPKEPSQHHSAEAGRFGSLYSRVADHRMTKADDKAKRIQAR